MTLVYQAVQTFMVCHDAMGDLDRTTRLDITSGWLQKEKGFRWHSVV